MSDFKNFEQCNLLQDEQLSSRTADIAVVMPVLGGRPWAPWMPWFLETARRNAHRDAHIFHNRDDVRSSRGSQRIKVPIDGGSTTNILLLRLEVKLTTFLLLKISKKTSPVA